MEEIENDLRLNDDRSHLLPTETSQHVPLLGHRHLMTFLIFLASATSYSMRVDLSIGIVAMVDKNSSNPDFEEFDWDSTTQNTILSSFFWGYIITQVPSGLIAQYLGAKILLLAGIFTSSFVTLLTPVVASSGGWIAVCALRVIAGLSQGTLFPSMHSILSQWVPPSERGRMASFAFIGSQVGTIITLALGGVLASSGGGWPSIFYVFGGIGIVWCVVWYFLGSSSPLEHKLISQQEKEYILQGLGETEKKVTLRTPWFYIFTSIPMWAIIIGHSGQNWGYWTLMTEMPTYMKNVLKFDIKSNGVLSALPYLVMGVLSFFFGIIADKTTARGLMTTSTSRKLFNTIGFWGPAAALAGLGYITDPTLGVTLLVLAVGLNGGVYLGFQVNHIDLSPNFAGTMMGITNGISNIMSIVGPLVVGFVVTDEESSEQWRIIFWIAAAVYFFSNIVFVWMGSAEIQPWNDPTYNGPVSKDERKNSEVVIATIS